jgi:hypothetical protein
MIPVATVSLRRPALQKTTEGKNRKLMAAATRVAEKDTARQWARRHSPQKLNSDSHAPDSQ